MTQPRCWCRRRGFWHGHHADDCPLAARSRRPADTDTRSGL